MTAITVTNTEYLIAAAMKTSFENATIDGAKVWKTVAVSLSETEARETLLRQDVPIAIVIYDDTTETLTVGDQPALQVAYTLLFATRLYGDNDDTARMQEGMRIVNAAKNVIESDLPASSGTPSYASAWGMEGYYQPQFAWGTPEISKPTDAERSPWVIARLPLKVGAVLTNQTSH